MDIPTLDVSSGNRRTKMDDFVGVGGMSMDVSSESRRESVDNSSRDEDDDRVASSGGRYGPYG